MEKENNELIVSGSEGFINTDKFKTTFITNITDDKTIFNLENNCDFRLNDCVGETITVVKYLCKIIEKPVKPENIIDETGIIKPNEFTMITILIDNEGKSYVTASKPFYFIWKKYVTLFGEEDINNGLNIRIIKKEIKNSNNKSLGFELV